MNKCTYCGKEYPDGIAVCNLDGTPLIEINAAKQLPIVEQTKWSWSFRQGLSWALTCGVGAFAGVRYLIAFGNYSLLLSVFGVAGLAFWLGGLRHVSEERAKEETDIRERVANMQKPKNTQD